MNLSLWSRQGKASRSSCNTIYLMNVSVVVLTKFDIPHPPLPSAYLNVLLIRGDCTCIVEMSWCATLGCVMNII